MGTKKRKIKAKDRHLWAEITDWAQSEGGRAFRKQLLKGAALAALGVMIAVGLHLMEGYVRRIAANRKVELQVRVPDRPAWATTSLVKDICLSSGIKGDDFILDQNLVTRCKRSLEANPWVKQVRGIQKKYDGVVEIDFEFREPIAMINQPDGQFYVDAEGTILPAAPLAEGHLIAITGGVDDPLKPGEKLKNEALLAGLDVLKLVRKMDGNLPPRERLWTELARLDVSNFDGRQRTSAPHLKFYSMKDTEILWGTALGREIPWGEPDHKLKLQLLYQKYSRQRSLDIYQYVDLRNAMGDPLRG